MQFKWCHMQLMPCVAMYGFPKQQLFGSWCENMHQNGENTYFWTSSEHSWIKEMLDFHSDAMWVPWFDHFSPYRDILLILWLGFSWPRWQSKSTTHKTYWSTHLSKSNTKCLPPVSKPYLKYMGTMWAPGYDICYHWIVFQMLMWHRMCFHWS